MATITREQVRWYRNLSGGPPPIQFFPEATSQSVPSGSLIGQICDLSSGRVRKLGGVAPGASVTSGTVLGVMADPFTNRTATSDVVSDRLGVVVASSETRFRIHVANGTGSQSLTAGMVGTKYGLINLSSSGASGIWCAQIGQTTTTRFICTGLIDAVGDINGAIEGVFEGDQIVYGD